MKELNTKNGVFLTIYTQNEIDEKLKSFSTFGNDEGRELFMSKIRSLNPESEYYICEEEASGLVGIEIKKNKKNPDNLYTNYLGNPFNISINESRLCYKSAINSLESAFKASGLNFDFKKDFFHIFIV